MRYKTPPQLVRRNTVLILGALLIAAITLMLMPMPASANNINDGNTAGSSCAQTQDGSDYTLCLPAGRWGGLVGSISGRYEPSKGVFGFINNIWSQISQTTRTIMPNMMLVLTQVFWSSALAMSNFAANFTPVDDIMKQIDGSVGALANGIMQGALPAMFLTLALLCWFSAAAFQAAGAKTGAKKVAVTVACLIGITVSGAAATQDANADTPTIGSPWWVVSSINDVVNKLTISLNLDGLSDKNKNMMAADVGNGASSGCQKYLYQMHQQYKNASGENDGSATGQTADQVTSALTSVTNRLWEETSLRSWVTMQWGSPSITNGVNSNAAHNAQQAYCHILDAEAGTDTQVQYDLVKKQLGDKFPGEWSSTQQYYFLTEAGYIDPWNSKVNQDDDGKVADSAWDRGNDIYRNRMAVFWETCDGTGARAGWRKLINNINDKNGDKGSGAIIHNKQYLRAAVDDDSVTKLQDSKIDWLNVDKGGKIADTACSAAFGKNPKLFNGDKTWDAKNPKGTRYADAALLGYTFDVPNADNTWNEANMDFVGSQADRGLQTTIGYLDNNTNIDTLGAFGAVIGGAVNMVVWGLLSLVLLISKLMLGMMGLFFIAALAIAAFPIGDAPQKTLKNWAKYSCNLSMTGMLIAFIGTIATFICQIVLNATSGTSGTFLYNLAAGSSPALAIVCIGLFCTRVAKIGNPFSIKAMMNMAGGSALVAGLGIAGRAALRRARENMFARRLRGKDEEGRGSSQAGSRYREGGESESGQVLSKAVGHGDSKGEGGDVEKASAANGPVLSGEGEEKLNGAANAEGELPPDAGEGEAEQASFRDKFADDMQDFTDKNRDAWDQHNGNYLAAMARNEAAFQDKYQQLRKDGLSDEDARRKAGTMRALSNARSTAAHLSANAIRTLSTGAAFTMAAARSQTLRDAVHKGISSSAGAVKRFTTEHRGAIITAAKVGLGATAMTNPFTAPIGVGMFASAVNPFNQNTRDAVGVAMGAGRMGIHAAAHLGSRVASTGAAQALAKAASSARETASSKVHQAVQNVGNLSWQDAVNGAHAVDTGLHNFESSVSDGFGTAFSKMQQAAADPRAAAASVAHRASSALGSFEETVGTGFEKGFSRMSDAGQQLKQAMTKDNLRKGARAALHASGQGITRFANGMDHVMGARTDTQAMSDQAAAAVTHVSTPKPTKPVAPAAPSLETFDSAQAVANSTSFDDMNDQEIFEALTNDPEYQYEQANQQYEQDNQQYEQDMKQYKKSQKHAGREQERISKNLKDRFQ